MMQFTLSDLLWALLLGARWTVALSLVAFVCGGALGFVLMLCTISRRAALRVPVMGFVLFVQGTPLLMQLFLIFYGPALFGRDLPAWSAACIGLTLWSSVYLAEIWRGAVRAVPGGQTEAGCALACCPANPCAMFCCPRPFAWRCRPRRGSWSRS